MKDYSLISFVLRGKRRKMILSCINKPMTSKEIAEKCKISIHNVSSSIKELVDKKLILCKNPEDKFYRFYEITKKGKDLLSEINQLN